MKMRHRKGFLYARRMQDLQIAALIKELEEAVEMLREALEKENSSENGQNKKK